MQMSKYLPATLGIAVVLIASTAAVAKERSALETASVKAATDCVAAAAVNNPNITTLYRENRLNEVTDWIVLRSSACDNPLRAMRLLHDRLYGQGTGQAFLLGDYLADLPRAVGERIKATFGPQANAPLPPSTPTTTKAWTLFKGGYWQTYGMAKNNEGVPMCGMQTGDDSRRLYIKWTIQDGVFFQVWKSSWRLTSNDAVPFSLKFIDNAKPGESDTLSTKAGRAKPSDVGVGSSVYLYVKPEDVSKSLDIFGEADQLLIEFPQGDEPTWNVKMDGSRNAATNFMDCISMIQKNAGTQPVLPESTQPFKPSESTSPTGKAKVKDDGEI
jgi:hypothetical protein